MTENQITPVTGKRLELLDSIRGAAYALIEIVDLEKSGIRDGEGYWKGSDPVTGQGHYLWMLLEQHYQLVVKKLLHYCARCDESLPIEERRRHACACPPSSNLPGADGICPGDAGGCMGDCLVCRQRDVSLDDLPF
jgi:hypothetical protein